VPARASPGAHRGSLYARPGGLPGRRRSRPRRRRDYRNQWRSHREHRRHLTRGPSPKELVSSATGRDHSSRQRHQSPTGCITPDAAVRAMPARLLLCLLFSSSWLTVECDGHVRAAGVRHRRGGRAAVAVSVGVAPGVPEGNRYAARSGLLLCRRQVGAAGGPGRAVLGCFSSSRASGSLTGRLALATSGKAEAPQDLRLARRGCACGAGQRPTAVSARYSLARAARAGGDPEHRCAKAKANLNDKAS